MALFNSAWGNSVISGLRAAANEVERAAHAISDRAGRIGADDDWTGQLANEAIRAAGLARDLTMDPYGTTARAAYQTAAMAASAAEALAYTAISEADRRLREQIDVLSAALATLTGAVQDYGEAQASQIADNLWSVLTTRLTGFLRAALPWVSVAVGTVIVLSAGYLSLPWLAGVALLGGGAFSLLPAFPATLSGLALVGRS